MNTSIRTRRRVACAILPLLALILTACFGSPKLTSSKTGNLRVESEPPRAQIILDNEPTGHTTPHTFTGLAPGIHELALVLDGYPKQGPKGVLVSPGETVTVKVDMNSQTVTGRVVYGRGGPPVAGSIVEAVPEHSAKVAATTQSQLDGTFSLQLPPGRYNIIARQPDTWAVGVAQGVQVPSSGPVEIIQWELFADRANANPQVLSITVTGLEPGDVVTRPTQVIVDVHGTSSSLVYFIGVRVGHQMPRRPDAQVNDQQTLVWVLDPAQYGPGDTYLHVVAYDVQLNAAQLIIPFTIPPTAPAGEEPLPAPSGMELAAYTFHPAVRPLSVEQLKALAEAMAPYGVSQVELTAQTLPSTARWVRIWWDPVPGAAGYRVYRRAEGAHELAVVADLSATRHPPVDVDGRLRHMYIDGSAQLESGKRYYYSVRAYDKGARLGTASQEVPVFLLEPFEAYLEQPAHHATVPLAPLLLRWRGTRLQPLPGYVYDYIYEVAILDELDLTSGWVFTATNREALQVPSSYLSPGRSYIWDLSTAYATVQVSDSSRAFAISGRFVPDATEPVTGRGLLYAFGGSMNGAFRFTVQPLP